MHIDASLSGGSIHVLSTSGSGAELSLRTDSAAGIRQWFHFRVQGARHADLSLCIVNAGDATYHGAWDGYRALGSYDLVRWFRVDTTYDGRTLVLRHRPEADTVHYGYFAAYPEARHAALVARAQSSPRATLVRIGESVEGRPIELLVLGDARPGKRRVWIVARQHPGETMAEFFVEGALGRLLDERDPLGAALLGEATLYVVPNLNPDGSARGNFRTNAAGRDINREWQDTDERHSPEVLAVRRVLEETGVDLFLDIHGDENAPCIFAIGCEGNPSYGERLWRLERALASSLSQRDPHFWPDFGYGPEDPGKGDLRIGNNWVGERFDCLSMTLEMPFKEGPGGFSPEAAARFGAVTLESALETLRSLR
jgi:murein tripeptide amidase MpaA